MWNRLLQSERYPYLSICNALKKSDFFKAKGQKNISAFNLKSLIQSIPSANQKDALMKFLSDIHAEFISDFQIVSVAASRHFPLIIMRTNGISLITECETSEELVNFEISRTAHQLRTSEPDDNTTVEEAASQKYAQLNQMIQNKYDTEQQDLQMLLYQLLVVSRQYLDHCETKLSAYKDMSQLHGTGDQNQSLFLLQLQQLFAEFAQLEKEQGLLSLILKKVDE